MVFGNISTNHQIDQLVVVEVGNFSLSDLGSVAKYRHDIGKIEYFVEMVGYHRDRTTSVSQSTNDFEEFIDLF